MTIEDINNGAQVLHGKLRYHTCDYPLDAVSGGIYADRFYHLFTGQKVTRCPSCQQKITWNSTTDRKPHSAGAAERLAQVFHETYERLAPAYGYETRKESAVPWRAVPEQNKALMIATVREVFKTFFADLAADIDEEEEGQPC